MIAIKCSCFSAKKTNVTQLLIGDYQTAKFDIIWHYMKFQIGLPYDYVL